MKKLELVFWDNIKGIRRLDPDKSLPYQLIKVNKNQTAFEWNMENFKHRVNVKNTIYCGSYHMEKMINLYPELKYYFFDKDRKNTEFEIMLKILNNFSNNILILFSKFLFLVGLCLSVANIKIPILPNYLTKIF